MRFSIRKFITAFFILMVTFVLASEQKIPNIKVLENPEKEITTVEGLKNREAAEMNIKVKKRNIEELQGVEMDDGIEFTLPKEILGVNDDIKVVRTLSDLPEETPINKRRKRDLSSAEVQSTVIDSGENKIVKISKKEGESTNYIIVSDKQNKEIKKVYKGRMLKLINLPIQTWKIDKRLQDNLVLIGGNWLGEDGMTYSTLEQLQSYSVYNSGDLVSVIEFPIFPERFSNISMIGKSLYKNSNGTLIFREQYSSDFNESLFQTTGAYFGISMKNSGSDKNEYRFRGDGKDYYFRVDEEYVGESAEDAVATLDVSHLTSSASSLEWSVPGVSGSAPSTGGISKGTLNFSRGKLFNWKTPVNPERTHIVTKMKVTNRGIVKESKPGYIIEFPKLTLAFGSKGALSLYKESNDLEPETYEIEIYNDKILLGKLTLTVTNRPPVDIGEVEFQVDKRLASNKTWIKANGESGKLNGDAKLYPSLMKVNNNFSNLESVQITDIISIEGRNNKGTSGGYKVFTTAPNVWEDESAMPFNVNLNNLRDNLAISTLNSTNSDMLNNRFSLLGSNGNTYKGNVKETYVGEVAEDAVASLDMSNVIIDPTSGWTGWNTPGVSGDANSTGGYSTVMKFSRGKLFNWNSVANPGHGGIITKLKVTNKGIVDEPTENNRWFTTTKFKNNIIKFSSNNIFIYKLTEDPTPETYEIEIYYHDILLGKLTLTVTNSSQVDIGEVNFRVDNRIPKNKLIFPNGDIRTQRNSWVIESYPKFVRVEGNFSNLENVNITEAISIEGRPLMDDFIANNIAKFDVASGTDIDSSYVPLDFNLSSIKDKILISNVNSNPLASGMENNIFKIKGDNNKFYKGNVKETYVGESAEDAVASLDMSNVIIDPVKGWSGWDTPGVSGDAYSTGGYSTVMKFSRGKLFNWKSSVATPGAGSIVTKLKVTNKGIVDEPTEDNRWFTTTKFKNNTIKLASNNIFIDKLTEDPTPETYEIEAYYKDILLGKLTLTITNKSEVNIGEVEFQVDKRLASNKTWIKANGGGSEDLTRDVKLYPNLMKVNNNFSNLESVQITDVNSIEGRNNKGTSGGYKVFTTAPNIGEDESAMPFNINLNNLRDNLAISTLNSTNSDMLNNRFSLLGSNGKNYKGNIKETYVGEVAQEGVATLDMSNTSINTWSGWNTPGVSGNATSTDQVPASPHTPVVMKFNSGKLFNWKSEIKPNVTNIMTRLKVTNRGKVQDVTEPASNGVYRTTEFSKNTIFFSPSIFYVQKLTEDPTPETYEIEIYYHDILLGKLTLTVTNATEVNIGEIEFKVDNRIPKRKLIFPNGDIKNTRDGNVVNSYPEFIGISGRFNNLESVNITEVRSVEGRPIKKSGNFILNNIARFDVTNGTDVDSSYIPLNFNLSSIEDKVLIDNINSNPLASGMENNIFKIKGDNNKFYKGNIKETYVGEVAQEGVATLDMSNIPINTWSGWETPGVSGETNSTVGAPAIMKFKNGKLFNWESAVNPNGTATTPSGSIVTKLKVTNRGIVDEITKTNVGEDFITTKFKKNKIEFFGSTLIIHKLMEDGTPETYEIETYYKDILLGKLTLTITNSTMESWGTVTWKIDKRLQDTRNLGNDKVGAWILENGIVTFDPEVGPVANYSALLNLEKFSQTIEDVSSLSLVMPGRQETQSDNFYTYFDVVGANDSRDRAALHRRTFFNTVSMDNSSNPEYLNNRFIIGGIYSGNIKEEYVGESAQEGVATLDMSNVPIDSSSGWDTPEVSGDADSTSGSATVMKFSRGKLFNWNSVVNPGRAHIVTKLKVTNRGVVDEITKTNVGERIETTKFEKNRIIIATDHLFIEKLTDDITPETYEIEIYHKEVLLGKLTLTVTNSTVINIGEMTLKADNRLITYLRSIRANWLNGLGGYSGSSKDWDHGITEAKNKYPLLVENTGDLAMISPVESWNKVVGRTLIRAVLANKRIYSLKNSSSQDGLVLPNTMVNGNPIVTKDDFSKYSVFNFIELQKGQSETDILSYVGKDEKTYEFKVNLAIGDEDVYLGEGNIDLTKLDINKTYTFEKSEIGLIPSSEDSNVKLNLISGKLPQPQGYSNQNIVDKLKVTVNGGSEVIINGKSFTSNSKYDISLDPTTGNLQVKKKQIGGTYADIVNIRYFYKEVELGVFTLNISSETSFEIIGSDIMEFENISQGLNKYIESNLRIKNLGPEKIVKISLESSSMELLKKDGSGEVLSVNRRVQMGTQGKEVPIKIELVATPREDQGLGDYEGEMNLYIDIE